MHCDVLIVGYRLNAKEPAAKALERILGITPEAARKMARSLPAVALENAPKAQAQALLDQLSAAGALVELRPRSGGPSPTATEPSTAGRNRRASDMFALDLETGTFPPRASSRELAASPASREPSPSRELAPVPPARELAPVPPRRELSPAGEPSLGLPVSRPLRGPAPANTVVPEPPGRASPPRPPPSPAAASATQANYQLGDFGLARPRPVTIDGAAPVALPQGSMVAPLPSAGSVVAPLPRGGSLVAPLPRSIPAPAMGGTADLDLELGLMSDRPLELDAPNAVEFGLDRSFAADSAGLHERFSNDEPLHLEPQQVEPRVARPQRPARPVEPRRSPAPAQTKKASPGTSETMLREWVPSLLLLAMVSIGSLMALGYALDPGNVRGALKREHEAAWGSSASGEPGSMLHPLLRATPAPARAALAAVLRANVAGVHTLPVSFGRADAIAQCSLVEHAEGQTEARVAQLRQTGREVAPPPEIVAQLREHERSLREAHNRPDLKFTLVCLTL